MKAAITGTGFMGATHLEGLRRLGIEVAGIHGSRPEKSRAVAEKFGLPRGYDTFEDLIADPEVGVVHITTPNKVHFEQASAALNAGKHVLCEKPLAMNSEESAELVRIAGEKDLAAGVNYNIRFYPICLDARERWKTGSMGKMLAITGSYVQDWLLYDTDYNWRVLAEEGGSLRAVADIGTHWLDLAQTITGHQVTSVMADLQTVHTTRNRPAGEVETFADAGDMERIPVPIETDDTGCILLRFDNGARGTLFVSQVTAGRKNCLRFEMSGSRSSMAWNSESPNTLWMGHRSGPNEQLMKDPSLLSEAAAPFAGYPGGHQEGYPDSFRACFKSFYDYIAAGDFKATPGFPTFAEGHHEIKLCDAILESHRRQGWVDVV